jgi:hypothetical protein
MIRTIFVILLAGMFHIAPAQDIITLMNGTTIKAKVLEIDLHLIRYKKTENPDGPVYTSEKDSVRMIAYENGSKDMFNRKNEMQESGKSNVPSGKINKDEELVYSFGKVFQAGRKLRPYDVKYKMNTNSEALRLYRSGRTLGTIGTVFQVVGIGDMALALAYSMQGYRVTPNLLIATVEIGIGVVFSSFGGNLKVRSIKNYNAGLKKRNLSSFRFGITPYGVGLCVKF